MKNESLRDKIPIFFHVAVSTCIGVVFIALVINDILSVTDMLSVLATYCVLAIIVFVLFFTSLLFLIKPHPARLRYVPLAVNIGTLLVGLLLYAGTNGKMMDFRWHYSEYNQAVHIIQLGGLVPDQGCLIDLPQQFASLSPYQRVCVSRTGNEVSVLFETSSEIDGFSRGYMYVSQGEPDSHFCSKWTPISGHSEWYYCGAYWIDKHYQD